MHHTLLAPRAVARGALLALLFALAAGLACAQEPARAPEAAPPPRANALIIPIGGTLRLQMTPLKPDGPRPAIKTAVNQKEIVARVQAVDGDPTSVLVVGLESGITRITLTDGTGRSESFDVVVQLDVEFLRSVLKRTVPTANIQPVPAGNNTVVLTGTVERAEDIQVALQAAQSVVLGPGRVIDALRVGGVMQVQLCVVVAQVARSEFRRMAFNFLTGENQFFLGSTVGSAVVNPSLMGLNSTFLGPNAALSGVPGTPNGTPTNILVGVLNTNSGFLAFLQALRQESVLKLLAEPRLVTLSGRPASFLSGGEQAVPVPAGLGQVGVQFEEFGTRLNFLPIVKGGGRIYLEVEPEVSFLNAANGTTIQGTVVPGRTTQRVHTSIELEDGQTFVIGGLIQNTVNGTTQKIPVLGDLPFLGVAFSAKNYEETETELVVMVTPRLVDPMACDQVPKVLPGMETRSPDDFELFLEGILEAPRGPRQICVNGTYVPAYRNAPNASQFPCAGGCCGGRCGPTGCGTGCCGDGLFGVPAAVPSAMPPAAPPAAPGMPTSGGEPAAERPATLPAPGGQQ